MSRFFTFCKTNTQKHNLKNKPQQKNMTIGFLIKSNVLTKCRTFVAVCLICAIIFMLGVYVVQTTSSATAGFKISEKQSQIEELKLANQTLQEKVNQLENLDNIKQQAAELGLAQINTIEYLDLSASDFALK